MDQLQQIQRAIDYIEDHLQQDLDIDAIAKVAAFSRWHFQIVFNATVGDTVKEYIRKRRLTIALIEIGTTEKRMIEIAMNAGYESQEAFTRAFKTMFGKTPGESRKEGIKSIMILNKPKITMEYLDHLYKGVNMEPVFKELGEIKVIGLTAKFISVMSPEKNNMVVIPALWGKYAKRATEIKSRKSWVDMGVCICQPENERSHPDECLYMAATEVTDTTDVPEGMTSMIIPAGKYAMFTHKGAVSKIGLTVSYIYGSWLPKSGQKLREAADLEMYDSRFNPDSDEFELSLYIPIE